jgi:hypothetical protein
MTPPERMAQQIPIAEIFYNPVTRYFGYRFHFEGRPPHFTLEAFPTLQDALTSCDPHNEHVWEDADDANERAIMVSGSYKPGSVLDRVSRAIPDAGRG